MTTAEVALTGESEPGARLSVNGGYVPVGDNGALLDVRCTAVAGREHAFASRPSIRAGNRTERSRAFVYRPAESVRVELDPAAAARRGGSPAHPRRRDRRRRNLERRGGGAAARGDGGRRAGGPGAGRTTAAPFHFTVPASEAGIAYRLEILGPEGGVEGAHDFVARQDAIPPEIVLDVPPPRHGERLARASPAPPGTPSRVTVNGVAGPARRRPLRRDADAWCRGRTGSRSSPTDAVGNVAVRRFETVYDVDPPEILSAGAGRPDGEAGPIEIVVEARDGSGLRQAAPYILTIGGTERRGFLRCDSAAGACRETLPPEPGALALVEVVGRGLCGQRGEAAAMIGPRARGERLMRLAGRNGDARSRRWHRPPGRSRRR